jgi:hypothetical protein
MATKILASDLAPDDVIGFGGVQYRVQAVRRDGVLVVAVLPRLGVTATLSPDHPVALVRRGAARMPLGAVTRGAGNIDLPEGRPAPEPRSGPGTTAAMAPAPDAVPRGAGATPASFVTDRGCQECGAPLRGRPDRRFCSGACRVAAYRRRTGATLPVAANEPMAAGERSTRARGTFGAEMSIENTEGGAPLRKDV